MSKEKSSEKKSKRLTGKQADFVLKYLGEARFNATLAAKLAGYRATSKHGFEAIGSENLTKLAIRATIDEHFKLSRMSSEECLLELSNLARGDSKDKVRALALLSSHFGLLDGAGRQVEARPTQSQISEQTLAVIAEVYGPGGPALNQERRQLEPVEVEIIPPPRRLQPAKVERMMRDLEDKPAPSFTEIQFRGQTVRIMDDIVRN